MQQKQGQLTFLVIRLPIKSESYFNKIQDSIINIMNITLSVILYTRGLTWVFFMFDIDAIQIM